MEKQKDVRLNKDFRNAYIKDFRSFLERQTNNPKYQSFLEARENCKGKIDDAFKTAKAVLERRFNPTDVADLRRLQNKYTTVDSVGKDSCFYMAVVDDKGKDVKEVDEDGDETIRSKHFDFNLKGSLNGSEYDRQKDFAYAWYREEMKANGLNPDCNIEHTGNQNNPHLSQHQNANSDWLKGSSGSSSNYVNKWNEDFALDIIGTGGCRSRAIPCTESEFARVATEKSEVLSKRYQKRVGTAAGGTMQTSLEVAIECLDAFEKNKQYLICGSRNRFLYKLTRIMSRQLVLKMTGRIFKKIAG